MGRRMEDFHQFMQNKCNQLIMEGKYKEAMRFARDGLEINSGRWKPYYSIIEDSLKALGEHNEAEVLYEARYRTTIIEEGDELDRAHETLSSAVCRMANRLNIR